MKIVAFTGPKGCGKDTAAEYLIRRNDHDQRFHFEKNAFASTVKTVCHDVFGFRYEDMENLAAKEAQLTDWPYETIRIHLQDVANWFRDRYGGDVWVRAWQARAARSQASCQVITDLRFPEELEMIQAAGGKVIYVHRDAAEEALTQAQSAGDKMASNVSEQHYDLLRSNADYVVYNNGSIPNLFSEIDVALFDAFSYRESWNSRALVAGDPR